MASLTNCHSRPDLLRVDNRILEDSIVDDASSDNLGALTPPPVKRRVPIDKTAVQRGTQRRLTRRSEFLDVIARKEIESENIFFFTRNLFR